jgi:hypothetical protein
VATTADVGNLLATGNMTNSVDNITVVVNDRVLVKDQTDAKQNGLYRVADAGTGANGTWIRTLDADADDKVTSGLTTTISEGDSNSGKTFKLSTPDPITLGTTDLTFIDPFAVTASAGGSINQVQFNDTGGTLNGSPGFTFDKTSNAVSVAGSISTANISVNGNVSATRFFGDGSQLTGLPEGYSNVQVATYLPTHTGVVTSSNVFVTGNITAQYIIGNGSQLTGITTDATSIQNSGTIVKTYNNGNVTVTGNLVPSANVTYNLGSPTQRWNVGYFAGNTIDLGGAQISVNPVTGTFTFTGNGTTTNLGGTSTFNPPGNVTIGGDLIVSGAVYIAGNTTTISTDNLTLSDSLIYLADGNPTDFLDIGFVGNFTRDALYSHTGFARDATDGVWKLFEGVEPEPTTVIDFGSASYATALIGNLVTRSNVTVGGNIRLGKALLTSAGEGGDPGQYLTSTGTGVAWTSIDFSTLSDGANTSIVADTANINITVDSVAVASFGNTSLVVTGNITSGNFKSNTVTLVSPTGDGAVLSSPGDLHTWKLSASFAVGAQETAPTGIAFKADGTDCYIVGSSGDDITQYSLSTPWDISTATFVTQSINLVDTVPDDLFFRPDGLKVYVVGSTNDAVREYDLGIAWDISTLSFVQAFSVVSEDSVPTGIFFKTDGTKMFISGNTNDRIYEYDLSTAWDVSTAVFSQFFSVQTQENGLTSLDFNSDGTIMWIVGTSSDSILQYNLSSAWDVSTATYYGKVYIGWQELTPTGIFVELAQNKAYVVGSTADIIFQYDTSATGLYIASDSTYVTGTVDFNNDVVTHSRLFGSGYSTWRNDGGTTLGTTGISGTATLSGAVTMSTTTGAINIHTSQTTGVFILGGTAATGAITLGRSTSNQTINLATGATTSGNTKVLNIGTAGLSGSTTTINIGSAVAGSTTTVSINGNATVSGNITSTSGKFIGDGSLLTGLPAGYSNVNAQTFLASGTLATAINTSGNISGAVINAGALNVSGTSTVAAVTSTGFINTSGNVSAAIGSFNSITVRAAVTAIANGGTSGVGNIGATGATFNTVFAKATTAQYADLAEVYTSDQQYPSGTVVVFGGESEVTQSHSPHDTRIAGVVSTNPAYLMNNTETGVPVALQGRVPCRVLGPVSKGDRVVSSHIPGVAQALDPAQYQPGCIIGKALQAIDNTDISVIEVVVGRL